MCIVSLSLGYMLFLYTQKHTGGGNLLESFTKGKYSFICMRQ